MTVVSFFWQFVLGQMLDLLDYVNAICKLDCLDRATFILTFIHLAARHYIGWVWRRWGRRGGGIVKRDLGL